MFQELAKAAYLQLVAENENARVQSERRNAKRLIEAAINMLDDWGVDTSTAIVDEATGVVELDGARFRGRALLGECQKCGEEVESDAIHNLARCGELLTKFEPEFDHLQFSCPKRYDSDLEAQPVGESTSTGQVLADALVAFLRDHGHNDAPF